jgi:hypothetical protein
MSTATPGPRDPRPGGRRRPERAPPHRLGRLANDSFQRFRTADGFSHSRALAWIHRHASWREQ